MANRVVLQATQSFIDTRTAAEKRINEIICQKIEEFLDMEDYNWTSNTKATQPSSYLEGILLTLIPRYGELSKSYWL